MQTIKKEKIERTSTTNWPTFEPGDLVVHATMRETQGEDGIGILVSIKPLNAWSIGYVGGYDVFWPNIGTVISHFLFQLKHADGRSQR